LIELLLLFLLSRAGQPKPNPNANLNPKSCDDTATSEWNCELYYVTKFPGTIFKWSNS